MVAIHTWWQLPYFWLGAKMYDFLAGQQNMETSYYLSRGKTIERWNAIRKDNLVGSLVYYDGLHNDARMNVSLALTAVVEGAVVANHVEVTSLIKDDAGKITGATMRDTLTGDKWATSSTAVINATGPFTDAIRKMDDPTTLDIVSPSLGTHIILPKYYSPDGMGLIDPSTEDGRVIFFLPWYFSFSIFSDFQGKVIQLLAQQTILRPSPPTLFPLTKTSIGFFANLVNTSIPTISKSVAAMSWLLGQEFALWFEIHMPRIQNLLFAVTSLQSDHQD